MAWLPTMGKNLHIFQMMPENGVVPRSEDDTSATRGYCPAWIAKGSLKKAAAAQTNKDQNSHA